MAQMMVRDVVCVGDVVVDATLGNGHDALFLAGLVGDDGRVLGFDVQEAAVESSGKRLLGGGVDEDRFEFRCVGHERMREFVDGGVKAVMFNLGYLPSADKSVITQVGTTLEALEVASSLLEKGGVMTVMCYPGHEGGDVEAEAVVEWAKKLERKEWRVVRYGFLNAPNDPPFLVGFEKLS